jgi:hypothetical protein
MCAFWNLLYGDVRDLKTSLPEDAQAKHRGFAILFNPPRPGRLLLVGLNPRRTNSSYVSLQPEGEQKPPGTHLYTQPRGGKLANVMRMFAESSAADGLPAGTVWEMLNHR